MTTKYPLAMHHPGFRKGAANFDGKQSRGVPDINPPVTVESKAQEDAYRARGYRPVGEAPPVQGYADYPKWLAHPEKGDALAKDGPHEQTLLAQGYRPKGTPNAQAFETAKSSPYDPGRVVAEYPRYEDGVLVQDPDGPKPGPVEFPKWIKITGKDGKPADVVVNSKAEEDRLTVPPSPEALAAERERKREDLAARKRALDAEMAALGEPPGHSGGTGAALAPQRTTRKSGVAA